MRNRQAGLTLIETVLVLMVAAILIGAIWIGYSQVRLNSQVDDTVAVLDETIQVTREYLAKYNLQNIPASYPLDMYNNHLMPTRLSFSQMTGITPTYISPMGYPFSMSSSGNPYFGITIHFADTGSFANVSPQQCLRFVPKIIGTTAMMNDRGLIGYLFATTVAWKAGTVADPFGGTPTAQLPTWTTAADGVTPISPATQLANCKDAPMISLFFTVRP